MKPIKPLGIKAYGSIPHLPGSRRGPGDKGLSEDQARICTSKARDKHDLIIVQEKLDGSCVAVAQINGEIVPLIRAGYKAAEADYAQHHHFAKWVKKHKFCFLDLLGEGERCVGEWLLQAHGTKYELKHEPFVAFDIMRGHDRCLSSDLYWRCREVGIPTPALLHMGGPLSIDQALTLLDLGHHGGEPEGAVWRVERHFKVDFLGKYVKPSKVDGCFLESVTGKGPVWNVNPDDL